MFEGRGCQHGGAASVGSGRAVGPFEDGVGGRERRPKSLVIQARPDLVKISEKHSKLVKINLQGVPRQSPDVELE